MTNNTSNAGCGCGTLLNILTVIFVVGKVFGFIDWSWWLVFSPTLLMIVFWIGVFLFAFILGAIEELTNL